MKLRKQHKTSQLVTKIVVLSLFVTLITLAVVSYYFLGGTPFGEFVNSTLGKFFNIFELFKNNWLTIVQSIVIILFFWMLNKLFEFLLVPLVKKRSRHSTFWIILTSVFKYLTSAIAIFLVLSAWGVDTPTLLVGAGILGLAISFGAQSLIEDVIAGLFIVFEKQFLIGDTIQVGNVRGKVTSIGIRTTTVEDIYGDVLIVNNSDLRQILNTSLNLSPANCEVYISYDQKLENIEQIIIDALPRIKEKVPAIKEGPFYRGVQKLDEHGVLVRIQGRTEDLDKYQALRDMNREVKVIFEEKGVKFGFPTVNINEVDNKEVKTK